MAKFDDVYSEHKETLGEETSTNFNSLTEKMGNLGYEVILNHKEKGEFVPSSRLGEVVSQSNKYKSDLEGLNVTLEAMKKTAGNSDELQKQLDDILGKNTALLTELEDAKVNNEIMAIAKDAVNAKDMLLFIERKNIKVNAKGEVLGVESEVQRLRDEKPYMFGATKGSKGGMDGQGDKGQGTYSTGMNAIFRRTAGIT